MGKCQLCPSPFLTLRRGDILPSKANKSWCTLWCHSPLHRLPPIGAPDTVVWVKLSDRPHQQSCSVGWSAGTGTAQPLLCLSADTTVHSHSDTRSCFEAKTRSDWSSVVLGCLSASAGILCWIHTEYMSYRTLKHSLHFVSIWCQRLNNKTLCCLFAVHLC